MTANLPVPTYGILTGAAVKLIERRQAAQLPTLEELQALGTAVGNAGSAAERADKHVQKWREGMAKMTLEIAFRDDPALDEAFRLIQATGAWKILQAACLESPKIMAELRSYWKPEDKVEIRD